MSHQPTEKMWQKALEKWKAKSEGKKAVDGCVFCDAFLYVPASFVLEKCSLCPLTMGSWDTQQASEGACWNPNHPWFAWQEHPNQKTAKVLYAFILARYEVWKAAE
jgi:hypothetical protein